MAGARFLGPITTGGPWSLSERQYHINVCEMLAALYALRSFRSLLVSKHVQIMLDSSSSVAIINHMGTNHNPIANQIAIQIWEFCYSHEIWLTASHIPGSQNVLADIASRQFVNHDLEWMLNPFFTLQCFDCI